MKKLVLCFFVASVLSGCASTKVKYGINDSSDIDGKIKFSLASSLIKLDISKCDKNDGNCTPEVKAVSVPSESKNYKYTIKPHDDIFSETHIKVTYIDNTNIISSIGSEIEDNTIKTIQAAGAGLAAILPIVGFDKTKLEPKLPIVIDVENYRAKACQTQPCKWVDLPKNENKWCYRLVMGEDSQDAVATTEFMAKFSEKESDVMIYSSCKEATLIVSKLTGTEKSCESKTSKAFNEIDGFLAVLKIADPVKVQTIKFPEKGKIDMHTSCGANLTDEKTDTASAVAVIGEILKQAKTIKEAQDQEKK